MSALDKKLARERLVSAALRLLQAQRTEDLEPGYSYGSDEVDYAEEMLDEAAVKLGYLVRPVS